MSLLHCRDQSEICIWNMYLYLKYVFEIWLNKSWIEFIITLLDLQVVPLPVQSTMMLTSPLPGPTADSEVACHPPGTPWPSHQRCFLASQTRVCTTSWGYSIQVLVLYIFKPQAALVTIFQTTKLSLCCGFPFWYLNFSPLSSAVMVREPSSLRSTLLI